MTGWLAYGFVQRALAAGVLVALLCSILAFFVVLKRLSFVGVGVSHSALGGVALGLLLGVNPFAVAAIFAVGVAWAIGAVARRGGLHEDAAIGILLSTAMALGVVLIGFTQGYQTDLFGYLFGNILAVSRADLWMVVGAAAVLLTMIAALFKELLFFAFDEEVAGASGLPTNVLSGFLLTAIALTVVVSIRVVGVILAEALLVIPAAVGYQLARGYRGMLACSCAAGVVSAIVGLWLSFRFNLAPGAAIVLSLGAIFFTTLLVAPRRAGRTGLGV
jgi:zinc transport system permease protein